MRKKFLLLAGVMAMLLVSAAPAAQAKTVQFETVEGDLPTGSPVEMENTAALKFTTGGGVLSCSSVLLGAKVGATKTDPATFTNFGTAAVSGCYYNGGVPFTTEVEVLGPMKFASNSTGELPVKFVLKFGSINCAQIGTLKFTWYSNGTIAIGGSSVSGLCFGAASVTGELVTTTPTGLDVSIISS